MPQDSSGGKEETGNNDKYEVTCPGQTSAKDVESDGEDEEEDKEYTITTVNVADAGRGRLVARKQTEHDLKAVLRGGGSSIGSAPTSTRSESQQRGGCCCVIS